MKKKTKLAPLDVMIDAAVRCTLCGARMGRCACWAECPCGWSYPRGEKCGNPDHK